MLAVPPIIGIPCSYPHSNPVNGYGQGIAFNKTVTVKAVSTPQEFPLGTSELSKRIYEARRAGLEITQIIDLKK